MYRSLIQTVLKPWTFGTMKNVALGMKSCNQSSRLHICNLWVQGLLFFFVDRGIMRSIDQQIIQMCFFTNEYNKNVQRNTCVTCRSRRRQTRFLGHKHRSVDDGVTVCVWRHKVVDRIKEKIKLNFLAPMSLPPEEGFNWGSTERSRKDKTTVTANVTVNLRNKTTHYLECLF